MAFGLEKDFLKIPKEEKIDILYKYLVEGKSGSQIAEELYQNKNYAWKVSAVKQGYNFNGRNFRGKYKISVKKIEEIVKKYPEGVFDKNINLEEELISEDWNKEELDNKEFKEEETIDNFDSGLSKYTKKDEIDISIFDGMRLDFHDYWKYNPDNPEADPHNSNFITVRNRINSLLRQNITLGVDEKVLFTYLFASHISCDYEYICYIFGMKNEKNLELEFHNRKHFWDTDNNVESFFKFVSSITNSNMEEDLKLAIKDEINLISIAWMNYTNTVENNYKILYNNTVSKKVKAYLHLLTVLTKVNTRGGKMEYKNFIKATRAIDKLLKKGIPGYAIESIIYPLECLLFFGQKFIKIDIINEEYKKNKYDINDFGDLLDFYIEEYYTKGIVIDSLVETYLIAFDLAEDARPYITKIIESMDSLPCDWIYMFKDEEYIGRKNLDEVEEYFDYKFTRKFILELQEIFNEKSK